LKLNKTPLILTPNNLLNTKPHLLPLEPPPNNSRNTSRTPKKSSRNLRRKLLRPSKL